MAKKPKKTQSKDALLKIPGEAKMRLLCRFPDPETIEQEIAMRASIEEIIVLMSGYFSGRSEREVQGEIARIYDGYLKRGRAEEIATASAILSCAHHRSTPRKDAL